MGTTFTMSGYKFVLEAGGRPSAYLTEGFDGDWDYKASYAVRGTFPSGHKWHKDAHNEFVKVCRYDPYRTSADGVGLSCYIGVLLDDDGSASVDVYGRAWPASTLRGGVEMLREGMPNLKDAVLFAAAHMSALYDRAVAAADEINRERLSESERVQALLAPVLELDGLVLEDAGGGD